MDVRTEKNSLLISARNFTEFRELLEKAEKEAQQLHETLRKLSCFEINVQLSIGDDHAGDMDAASSAIKHIPTK
ncbi:MAG: hypothetical protein IKO00_07490 [Oscillospiraceae bacterium]|nr:hypothetical protein [Oscillospiraceae bacterium]